MLPSKHTRPPLERMQKIHERISTGDFPNAVTTGDFPNAVTLGLALEVTDRTVKRDIEFMRGRFGLPIEYHDQRHGYYYTRPVDRFPVAAMTEAELFALLVADKAIAQYHGMPFQKPLRMAFKKLTGQLDAKELYSLENLGLALSFRPFAPEDADLNAFRLLTRALQEGRALKFDYRNLAAKNSQPRHVHPYHLACIDNHWYFFAHDVNRQQIRTFALTRLSNPTLADDRFTRPKSFDPDKYLQGSFAVMKGDQQHDVLIEFDAWATDLIRGRQWHSSQKLLDLPDGRSQLKMLLNSLEEIERWILSWGIHAKVLSPEPLQSRIKQTATAITTQYDSPS